MMMTRRLFTSALAGAALPTSTVRNVIETDGVSFTWLHRDNRLCCELAAPTQGWIAAGFNDRAELKGTQFVMADLASKPPRAELHLALVPDHCRIEDLGGRSGLVVTEGEQANGNSRLVFSLPEQMPAPFPLDLRRGSKLTLMLAWSLAREFDHHSAWRKHFQITL
jgi:hypothetical protein